MLLHFIFWGSADLMEGHRMLVQNHACAEGISSLLSPACRKAPIPAFALTLDHRVQCSVHAKSSSRNKSKKMTYFCPSKVCLLTPDMFFFPSSHISVYLLLLQRSSCVHPHGAVSIRLWKQSDADSCWSPLAGWSALLRDHWGCTGHEGLS